MAKESKAAKTTDLEASMAELLERVSPGRIALVKPSYAVRKKRTAFDLTITTRSADVCFFGDTVGEAVEEALGYLSEPTEDPIVPGWSRLTRFQREIVVQTLREIGARHMARAAEAKIGGSAAAHAEYEMADAFHAAIDVLDRDDVDATGMLMAQEPLAAETVHLAKPRARAKGEAS